MSKKVTNERVAEVMKSLEAIHEKTLYLMEKSVWIAQEGSAELVKDREEIEFALSDIMVLLIGFAGACDIDIDAAIETRLKEIHKIMGLPEESFDAAFNGSASETETTV
jgi:hypothetical protein